MTTAAPTATNSAPGSEHDQSTPWLLNPTNPVDRVTLNHLRSTLPPAFVSDTLLDQLQELLELRAPAQTLDAEQIRTLIQTHLEGLAAADYGTWVHYPWSQRLVHLLPLDEFQEVRLSRNRNKITAKEQAQLRTLRLGIAGLSVGQATAITLAMEGIGGHFVLADFDALSLSNMNRLRASVHDIGVNKAVLTARALYEIDPYIQVTLFPRGLTDANLEGFIGGDKRLDLLIEECDDMYMKIKLREVARSHRIPVIMETSDRGMLDVERFDLEPQRALLHGRAGIESERFRAMGPSERVAAGMAIVGADVSPRLAASALEMGATLRTWPQLASAISLGAAINTDTVRRIALGEFNHSGRFYVELDQLIGGPTKATDPPSKAQEAPPRPAKRTVREHAPVTDASIRLITECAAAAPSGGNQQPWKFLWNGTTLRCMTDVPVALVDHDYCAKIALGAAVENILLAAEHLGWGTTLSPFPVPGVVCDVSLTPNSKPPVSNSLYGEIFRRCTNRRLGLADPLPATAVEALHQATQGTVATFTLIDSREKIREIGDLVGAADRLRLLCQPLHKELMSELRWTAVDAQQTRDGIDLRTLELGVGDLAALKLMSSWPVMQALGSFGGGRRLEDFAHRMAAGSSAFGLLTIPNQTPHCVFEGGRVLQRLWLVASRLNLGFQPMSAMPYLFMRAEAPGSGLTEADAMKFKQLRAHYQTLMQIPQGHSTLMLFRLALVPEPSTRSVRRPVDDILFNRDGGFRHENVNT